MVDQLGQTSGRREQGLSTNRRPPCQFSNSTGCPLSFAPPPVHPSASARNSTRMLPVGSAQHRKAAGVEISRFCDGCVHSRPPFAPARSAQSQVHLSQQSTNTSSNVFRTCSIDPGSPAAITCTGIRSSTRPSHGPSCPTERRETVGSPHYLGRTTLKRVVGRVSNSRGTGITSPRVSLLLVRVAVDFCSSSRVAQPQSRALPKTAPQPFAPGPAGISG
ncbi:hypothetical protein DE146DRAFT_424922 [Phaeosphaeria sp. MPI-PUGE-AT-0046c]|nr:hypothetical protein DE146DRAFT_424922 [Phaeosphaeria sp. MPI-PUGE-AT-0046c]